MAEFVITWSSGKTERWEQSDCATVEQAANTRFGSAVEAAGEAGVTLELAADYDARMAGQQEEIDAEAAARLAVDSNPPLGAAPQQVEAAGSQADFEAIMKATAADHAQGEATSQESNDAN